MHKNLHTAVPGLRILLIVAALPSPRRHATASLLDAKLHHLPPGPNASGATSPPRRKGRACHCASRPSATPAEGRSPAAAGRQADLEGAAQRQGTGPAAARRERQVLYLPIPAGGCRPVKTSSSSNRSADPRRHSRRRDHPRRPPRRRRCIGEAKVEVTVQGSGRADKPTRPVPHHRAQRPAALMTRGRGFRRTSRRCGPASSTPATATGPLRPAGRRVHPLRRPRLRLRHRLRPACRCDPATRSARH